MVLPCVTVDGVAVAFAVGGVFGVAWIVTVTFLSLLVPSLSLTVKVMVCVPTDRVVLVKLEFVDRVVLPSFHK